MNEETFSINIETGNSVSSLNEIGSAFSDLKIAGEGLQSSLDQFASTNPFESLLGSIGAISGIAQGLSGLSEVMNVIAKHPFMVAILGIAAALTLLESETGMVSDLISGLAPIFQQLLDAAQPFIAVLADMGAQIMSALAPAFSQFMEALAPLLPQIGELVSQLVSALAPILPALAEAFMSIVTALAPLLPVMAELIAQLVTALAPILPIIAEAFMSIIAALIPLLPPLVQMISAILPVIVALIQTLVPIITMLAQVFVGVLKVAIDAIVAVLKFLMPIITFLVDLLAGVLVAALNVVADVFTFLMDILVNVIRGFGDMVSAIRDGAAKAFQWVSNIFGKIVSTIGDAIGNAVNFVTSLPGKIMNALAGAGGWLVDIGKDMINGLIDGAKSLLGNIGSFFLDIVPGWIKDPFKAALGIHSPSRVFAGFGEDILRGLADGIASSAYLAERAVDGVAGTLSTDFRAAVDTGSFTNTNSNAPRPAPVINQYNTNYTEFDQDQALAEFTWLFNRARS